jgi:threonyl-tRNA synthetase
VEKEDRSDNMRNIKEDEKLNVLNHSCAHLLAHAVKRLYPEAKLWVGPVIESGFYYDIDMGEKVFSEDDLAAISKEMKKIAKSDKLIKRIELSKAEAIDKFKDNEMKLELINEMPEDEIITAYIQDEFMDLCRGPHVEKTKLLKNFKLLKVSGAYYKGDINNRMLQRIYGVCFETAEELEEHLQILEEAKNRDHRKLGKELDLFCYSDLVGPGLPLFTPKGTVIKDELQKAIEKVCRKYGFQKVFNPHLANIKLFETSGHASKFSEELFHVTSEKGHEFVLKPVLCPHHTQLYAAKNRSYRELPVRYMESEKMHRAELQGAVSGLSRVYAITVEDGHVFCTVDQIKEEIVNLVNIIKDFYGMLGMWGDHWVSLSVRDYNAPEKYIGDPKDWDVCEQMLEDISNDLGLDAKRCEGEAALYGPKLDFMFKDVLGREIQIPTIQLDFATPKRFDLTYINSEGKKEHPVMIHRAVLGSYERLMMLLIEQFAGAFPLWLEPVQVNVIPVNNEYHLDKAKELFSSLFDIDIRVELDDRDEKMGYKIRESQMKKIPYTVVLGDKEVENDTITYRKYGTDKQVTVSREEFVNMLIEDIKNKVIN